MSFEWNRNHNIKVRHAKLKKPYLTHSHLFVAPRLKMMLMTVMMIMEHVFDRGMLEGSDH
jgi:hypothetical protein